MKKTCPSCTTEKDLSDFNKDKSRKDGYQPYCKICTRERHASAYTRRYKDKTRTRDKMIRNNNVQQLDIYKRQHPCVCCGEHEPVCLDFHHVDPSTKSFGIAGGMQRSWKMLLTEIKKCVVLCATCHRKVHAGIIVL